MPHSNNALTAIDNPVTAPPADEPLTETTLDSGLHVSMIPRPSSLVVACRLYVRAGSRHDEGHLGRAHLSEHCQASAAAVGHEPVEEYLARLGSELDATTHREYMHFGTTVLPEALPATVGALGAILGRPPSDPDLISKQQCIIEHEQMDYQDGGGALWDELLGALYEDHPFLPPAVGDSAVQQLGASHLHEHWRRFLRPNRAVLAVVGAFQPEQLLESVERQLAHWQRGEPVHSAGSTTPRPRPEPQCRKLRAQLRQSHFLLGWPIPPAGGPQDAALAVLAELLTSGPRALLTSQLREQRAELYQLQAHLLQYGDSGTLIVAGSCAPRRLPAVLNQIADLVAGDAGLAFDDAQLERFKLSYRGALMQRYETAGARARVLGLNALWGIRRTLLDRMQQVTALHTEQLNDCRRSLLVGRAPAVAVLGP